MSFFQGNTSFADVAEYAQEDRAFLAKKAGDLPGFLASWCAELFSDVQDFIEERWWLGLLMLMIMVLSSLVIMWCNRGFTDGKKVHVYVYERFGLTEEQGDHRFRQVQVLQQAAVMFVDMVLDFTNGITYAAAGYLIFGAFMLAIPAVAGIGSFVYKRWTWKLAEFDESRQDNYYFEGRDK